MKYRKKPVVIEAFQLLPRNPVPQWLIDSHNVRFNYGPPDAFGNVHWVEASIKTLEGTMKANNGDWIIKGVKSELYPCKPDIFEATYEAVPDQPKSESKL